MTLGAQVEIGTMPNNDLSLEKYPRYRSAHAPSTSFLFGLSAAEQRAVLALQWRCMCMWHQAVSEADRQARGTRPFDVNGPRAGARQGGHGEEEGRMVPLARAQFSVRSRTFSFTILRLLLQTAPFPVPHSCRGKRRSSVRFWG